MLVMEVGFGSLIHAARQAAMLRTSFGRRSGWQAQARLVQLSLLLGARWRLATAAHHARGAAVSPATTPAGITCRVTDDL